MLSQDELRRIEAVATACEGVQRSDVLALLSEVRRLHAEDKRLGNAIEHWHYLWTQELEKNSRQLAAFNKLREQVKAWKRKALEYRNRKHRTAETISESAKEWCHQPEVQSKLAEISRQVDDSYGGEIERLETRKKFLEHELDAIYDLAKERLDSLDSMQAERDALRAAITEYASAGDSADVTPEAWGRFRESRVALLRLVGFRPRVRARSEVERG